MKALVVGAGLAGMTAAVLLKRSGHDVLVMEKRKDIGGNCIDDLVDGVHVHRYGPHIFHTNDARVWKFVNEFTGFTDYQHRVMASIGHKLISIPYSKRTAEELGRDLSDGEIVDMLFRVYSERMWGCRFSDIPPQITKRVNLRRSNSDTRYFMDKYQGMPSNGYDYMFNSMKYALGPCIFTGCADTDWRGESKNYDLVVYTGMLDEYFDCEHGQLPYRGVDLKFDYNQEHTDHAVINFCHSGAASRMTDYSCFYGYPKDWPRPWIRDEEDDDASEEES